MKNKKENMIRYIVLVMTTLVVFLSASSSDIKANRSGSIKIYRLISAEHENSRDNPNSVRSVPLIDAEISLWRIDSTKPADQIGTSEGKMKRIGESQKRVKTDANGIAHFSDLESGIYYIEETSTQGTSFPVKEDSYLWPSCYSLIEPLIISVPAIDPDRKSVV